MLRVASVGARQGPTLWRSSLRCDCAAVLGLESHRRTHFAPCGRFVQTSCAKSDVDALRAAMRPPLLSVTEARLSLPEPAFAATAVACSQTPPLLA